MKALRFSALLVCVLLVVLGAYTRSIDAPIAKVTPGEVSGVATGDLVIFKGIPYAAPPVGKLRWRAPQPVRPWRGVRAATDYGHDCMQLAQPGFDAPLQTTPDEDCLYLNVWAPRIRGSVLLPVMVWIYGGGFVDGGSSSAVFDGSHFAESGVVLVSFNYRLGRFGFFAFPALVGGAGPIGNYAFMDQIACLRWVRTNIAAFGGNPREVTIVGQSAGATSVIILLTSPLARGLFQRAVIESDASRNTVLPPVPLDHPGANGRPSAEQIALAFARGVGVRGKGAAALADLRGLPSEKIVDGLNMASWSQQRGTHSGPILDGKLVVEPPEQAFREGRQAKVPVLLGANSADLGSIPARSIDDLLAAFGPNAERAKLAFDVSPSDTPATVGRRVGAVRLVLEPTRFIAQRVAAAGQPAYEYRFSYAAVALRQGLTGAPRSAEIPYVFDTIRLSKWSKFGNGITAEDLRTARQMNSYWVNFVKTGNPNGAGMPHWPKYTQHGDELTNFTLSGPLAGPDPWRLRLDLVEEIQK